MAKKASNERSSAPAARRTGPADGSAAAAADIRRQVIALAEKVGGLAGKVRGKTDVLLDRKALKQQLSHIKEMSASLVDQLTHYMASGDEAPAAQRSRPPRGRSGGKVDAPGKKHRKAPEPGPKVPHSDERIAKLAANRVRRTARFG